MKKIVRIVFLMLTVGLASQGFAAGRGPSDGDVKVVLGEGRGATHDAALQDALRNVLRNAVGVYVDSEIRMRNDEIIKDEIIMHSNGLIERYKILEEENDAASGLMVIAVRAHVKVREILDRVKKIAPSQTVAVDGVLLANEIGNQANAEKLLRKVFENRDLKSLLEIRQVESIRPERQASKGDDVVMRYAFVVQYSPKEYDEKFLPQLAQVLTQIAKGKPKVVPLGMQNDSVSLTRSRPGNAIRFEVRKREFTPIIYNKERWRFEEWKDRRVPGDEYSVQSSCGGTFALNVFKNVASVVWEMDPAFGVKVKTWPLDDYLLSTFLELRDSFARQFKDLRCELSALDQDGNVLACSETRLPFWGGHEWNCNMAPFIKVMADDYKLFDGYLEYYGCIDVTIKHADLSRVSSLQFKLK